MSQLRTVSFFCCLMTVVVLFPKESVGTCSFTTDDLEYQDRYAVRVRTTGSILLHTDKVNHGSRVKWICNASDQTLMRCYAQGMFRPPTPQLTCLSPVKASVAIAPRDGGCSANLYAVGYAPHNADWIYYKSCYDTTQVKALYVIHTVHAFNPLIPRPNVQFTLDGIVSARDAQSFKQQQVYSRFETLLGPNQHYITSPTQLVIHRGHLAPSADFLFPQAKAATFKYINAVPMFGSINQGNWRRVEDWVRDKAARPRRLVVVTGSLGVLHLCSASGAMIPIYLQAGNRVPVPSIVFKMIPYERTVFATVNNIYINQSPPAICTPVNCPINFPQNAASGFTYCCDYNNFKQLYLPSLNV